MRGKRHILVAVFFLMVLPALCAASAPTNEKVDRDVDEITADKDFDWLRKGGQKGDDMVVPPVGKGSGKGGTGLKPSTEKEGNSCGFDPNFEDLPTFDDDDCGGRPGEPSTDCDCDPGMDACNFEPLARGCGSCVPSSEAIVPLGYAIAALALALIIFFVVRTIIQRMPSEDVAIAVDDADFDDDEMRVSRIHQVAPASLLALARDAAASGDFKRAVGYLYLLSLSILSRTGVIELDKSTTNWHILGQIAKNAGPIAGMRVIVRHFEDLFFGNKPPTAERYEECNHFVSNELLPLEKEETHAGS